MGKKEHEGSKFSKEIRYINSNVQSPINQVYIKCSKDFEGKTTVDSIHFLGRAASSICKRLQRLETTKNFTNDDLPPSINFEEFIPEFGLTITSFRIVKKYGSEELLKVIDCVCNEVEKDVNSFLEIKPSIITDLKKLINESMEKKQVNEPTLLSAKNIFTKNQVNNKKASSYITEQTEEETPGHTLGSLYEKKITTVKTTIKVGQPINSIVNSIQCICKKEPTYAYNDWTNQYDANICRNDTVDIEFKSEQEAGDFLRQLYEFESIKNYIKQLTKKEPEVEPKQIGNYIKLYKFPLIEAAILLLHKNNACPADMVVDFTKQSGLTVNLSKTTLSEVSHRIISAANYESSEFRY